MRNHCAVILLAGLVLHTPLISAADAAVELNVSIVIFDPGVPQDRSMHRQLDIFPRIREIESLLFPFVLGESLVETGGWGAVRVEPAPDLAAELLLEGKIVHSDGESMSIEVCASDATGRIWIDRLYSGDEWIYTEIVADLGDAKDQLDREQLEIIQNVAMLRYARSLAPSAFGDYLGTDDDGMITLERLPARDDPMLGWIHRIRETVYVYTDTVDEKYQALHADIASVYALWREYREKTRMYEAQNTERAAATGSAAPRGSYRALLNQYENYKWNRITAQEQDRLAVAFDNEVGPRVAAMESRIAELEGWVEDKYTEWHQLLEALFDAETASEPIPEDLIEEVERLVQ